MSEVRVGVVGTDNTHAYTYCAFLNGWDEQVPIPVRLPSGAPVPDMYLWAMQLRRSENDPAAGVPIDGVRVTSIWSADPADADLVARACRIDKVCDTPEQVCQDVDAVMILSEDPATHLPYARPALERGLRTYVDKPLAESPETGQEIFALAEHHGAPCYTGSGVRWSPEFLAARDRITTEPGPLKAVHVQCPLELGLYGIHAIEMVNLFLGHHITSIQAIQAPGRQVALFDYGNGTTATIEHLNFLRWPTYSATLYGDTWHHTTTINDPAPTALAFTRAFATFAAGGPTPVPPTESLHLINILTTTQHALAKPPPRASLTGEPAT